MLGPVACCTRAARTSRCQAAFCCEQVPRTKAMLRGTWCSGITSAPHAEVPGLKSQCVHARQVRRACGQRAEHLSYQTPPPAVDASDWAQCSPTPTPTRAKTHWPTEASRARRSSLARARKTLARARNPSRAREAFSRACGWLGFWLGRAGSGGVVRDASTVRPRGQTQPCGQSLLRSSCSVRLAGHSPPRQSHDSLAEWSKALASGASPYGRGLEPHSCHS